MRRLYRIFFVIHENSTKKVKDDNGKMTRVLMYLMCNDLIYRVQCCVLFTKTLSKGKIGKQNDTRIGLSDDVIIYALNIAYFYVG